MIEEVETFYKNKHFYVLKMLSKCCSAEFSQYECMSHGQKSYYCQCKGCGILFMLSALTVENHENVEKWRYKKEKQASNI